MFCLSSPSKGTKALPQGSLSCSGSTSTGPLWSSPHDRCSGNSCVSAWRPLAKKPPPPPWPLAERPGLGSAQPPQQSLPWTLRGRTAPPPPHSSSRQLSWVCCLHTAGSGAGGSHGDRRGRAIGRKTPNRVDSVSPKERAWGSAWPQAGMGLLLSLAPARSHSHQGHRAGPGGAAGQKQTLRGQPQEVFLGRVSVPWRRVWNEWSKRTSE